MNKADTQNKLNAHVSALLKCRRCPGMASHPVSGGPVMSKVMLIGQAPGDKEPKLGRPFAWTAGKTLFRWFQEAAGIDEATFRKTIYMAAVCRCFPGKKAAGGDRVPSLEEVGNCSDWLEKEIQILRPELVIPIGKLAISLFIGDKRLEECVGQTFKAARGGVGFDVIPLPHSSGASPWRHQHPGKKLLDTALKTIAAHTAIRTLKSINNI